MTSSHSAQASRVGEEVGSYRLVRFIGAGGMGEVYEACHTTLGTRQAIKFLRGDMVRRVDLVLRFEQEARIADALQSRHIIKVRDFGRGKDGTPYMVMDLAEGRSLARILAEEGRFEPARAIDLVHQACAGLRVAHDARIIHRDLKPENLYVCREDDGTELVKILDFGIAKHLGGSDQGPTTETGSNLGTAHYMSPEQAQGAKRAIDHRTDIYSLGVILYEMLSGTKPYDGESYNEILIRIVTQRPVPLEALRPDLPRGLVSVVRRAMAREPTARFQSAFEFARALAPLRTHVTEATDPGPALEPAARPRSSDQVTLASDPEDRLSAPAPGAIGRGGGDAVSVARGKEARPSRLGWQLLLAIVAVAAVTAAALALRHDSGSGPPPSVGHSTRPALGPTLPPAPRAPKVVTTHPAPSANSSTATSVPGQNGGQPKATRPPRSTRSKSVAAAPPPADEVTATRPPTIDQPLPASPHAPGVSPVME
jgi:eukaryotic-like serine/threonine-protein kinase